MTNRATNDMDALNDTTRVSTMELFFDLVFVFTITQLTDVLLHHLTWEGLAQIAIMLGVIWWIYAGFAWLTNAVAPNSTIRRTLLFAGMAGFLIIALAIPDAFGDTGLVFGIGYLVVTIVHACLFIISSGSDAQHAMMRLAPYNLASAGLILLGGFTSGWPQYALWAGALVLQIATPYLHGQGGFTVQPSHFAERHGLIIIVALGESVVSIGLGLAEVPLTISITAVVVLALTLCYALYWAYFGFDSSRGEEALTRSQGVRRARKALTAYGYAHYPMLLGIVALAAGIKLTIAHEGESLSLATAFTLAAGTALFFVGHGAFRWVLNLVRPWMRLALGAAVLATILIGVGWIGWAQLVALIGVVFVFIIADDLLAVGKWDLARR